MGGRGRTPPLRSDTRCGAWPGGRPQGSPLRRVTRGAVQRGIPLSAAPLGKGAEGTGVRIATAGVRTGFAMTWFFARGAVRGRVGDRKGRPYGGLQGVQWLSDGRGRTPPLRSDKRCGAWPGGRPQGSPLRRVTRGAVQHRRADRGVRPYGDVYVFFSAHRKTPGMAPAFQVWVLCACGAVRHHLYYM